MLLPAIVVYGIGLLWSTCLPVAAATLSADDQRRISAAVARTLSCSDVPGLTLSVVGDGRVLVERGYGVASVTSRAPVTVDTLFPLGSTTKAFTTALLALLIDKHADLPTRFNWSTPIRDIIGDSFALYNDELTYQTTLEDILSHRTGIPDYFLLLVAGYPYIVTRQQVIWSLRYHKPMYRFRDEYLYNNHMYVLAGHVAEVLESKSWEQLVSAYLLKPLGMTSTTFVRDVLMTSPANMASSCSWMNGSCHPVELQLLDQVNVAASAGAIVSSARDMSSWMLWHLSGGALPGNESLISRTSLWQTYAQYNKHFARHMTARDVRRTGRLAPVSSANQTTGEEPVDVHVAYDLGWMTSLYRGARRVWHSGSISTYKTQVWLFPDQGYGLFVSVAGPNRPDTTTALIDLMHQISDVLLERHQRQSSSTDATMSPPTEPTSAASADRRAPDCSNVSTPPQQKQHNDESLPKVVPRSGEPSNYPNRPERFVGSYYSAEYLTNATVTLDGDADEGGLRLSVGRLLTAELRHFDAAVNQFDAIVDGQLWWFAEPASGLPVRFAATSAGSDDDVIDAVELQLYSASPNDTDWARFRRMTSSATTTMTSSAYRDVIMTLACCVFVSLCTAGGIRYIV